VGNPLYRVRASGRGGSGYGRPPLAGEPHKQVKNADGDLIDVVVDEDGKPIIVPGVTTVIKVADGDGLIQWSVDQVAAYAVANVDSLLNRTMEQGWGMLRFYHKRKPDLEDPLRNAHSGVLNDLAQLGTTMHDYIEIDLWGEDFPPQITSPEMAQMVDSWHTWKFMHDIKVVYTEVTLWHPEAGYAGTFDLLAWIDGELWLIDVKTSRRVGKSHMMQLAALREAPDAYTQDEDGQWIRLDLPKPTRYGFIQVRPDDTDYSGNPVPSFVALHEMSEELLDVYWERFKGCLAISDVDARLKELEKEDNQP
jgi:hypothetical protein